MTVIYCIQYYTLNGLKKLVPGLLCRLLDMIFFYLKLTDELYVCGCRLLKQNKKSDELLEQYRCEIQEFKLKHRKQRYIKP